MAVIIQYIVERNGIQKMTFMNKKDAEAYDKQLDIAENISSLIESSDVSLDAEQLEGLSIFLAKNSVKAMAILKGSKPASASAKKKQDSPSKEEKKIPESDESSASEDSVEILAEKEDIVAA